MPFLIYDYVNQQGQNKFKEWTSAQQKVPLGKLNEKIDLLSLYGETLFPHMLTDTGVAGILKLRVQGSVKLRPLLCRGPVNNQSEYTLLMGAKEIGSKWEPKGAPSTAAILKAEVIKNPTTRRVTHERVL